MALDTDRLEATLASGLANLDRGLWFLPHSTTHTLSSVSLPRPTLS